jgi:MinD superfamily P-loop ATPase
VSGAILGAEDLAVVENDGANGHGNRLQGALANCDACVAVTERSGGPFDCARLTCEPGFAQDDTRLV